MFVSGKKALRHQLLLEGYTEEELESLWNFIHTLFLEMDQFLQSLYKHVKLWEKLLYLFTFYVCFTIFPDALRHVCTTMPWTIRPSLVILWGVCWMFYGSPPNREDNVFTQFYDAGFSCELGSGKHLFLESYLRCSYTFRY